MRYTQAAKYLEAVETGQADVKYKQVDSTRQCVFESIRAGGRHHRGEAGCTQALLDERGDPGFVFGQQDSAQELSPC